MRPISAPWRFDSSSRHQAGLAEWLGIGLPNRLAGFESPDPLQISPQYLQYKHAVQIPPWRTLLKASVKIPPVNTAVKVEWYDAVGQPGWHYALPGETPDFSLRAPMITRGVLAAVTASYIAIAPTIAPIGPTDLKKGWMDVLTIPRGCVLSIKEIE